MGQEYRLVSEDEWQTLRDELAWHKAEAKRLEVEGARLENEVYNLRWQYSHVDPNADEPESEEDWEEKPIREVETKFYINGERVPVVSGHHCDGEVCSEYGLTEDGIRWSAHFPAHGCPKCCEETVADLEDNAARMIAEEPLPQRPHESLVWAIYHAAAWTCSRDAADHARLANQMMNAWRSRWPEPEE